MIVNSNKMKSPDKFIIRMPEKFKNKIAVGDQELELVSKFDEFGNRIMEAEIVAVPAKYETGAKPGDLLYFHHTVALNDTFYIGYSSDVKQRVKDHRQGKVPRTRNYIPLKLVFYAAFVSKKKALEFERYLKTKSGFAFRNKRLV